MIPEKYSNIGKGGVVKEGIFVRFPDFAPACDDKDWSKTHSKLIIVGESNFFTDDVPSVFKDPEAWYKGEDTQHLVPPSDDPKEPNKYSKLVNTYKTETRHVDRLLEAMREVSQWVIKCIYSKAIYYNYFLRPATYKKGNQSFKKDCKPIDCEVAGVALCEIIDIEEPDIVIFASKYAYDVFQEYIKKTKYETKARIEFVYHPSRDLNWNSANGKQKFENLLREYWIKK